MNGMYMDELNRKVCGGSCGFVCGVPWHLYYNKLLFSYNIIAVQYL